MIPARSNLGVQYETFSYRHAEEILNAHLAIKREITSALDTVVAAYPERTVEGDARLGYDSVLGTDPDPPQSPSLQIGAQAWPWMVK